MFQNSIRSLLAYLRQPPVVHAQRQKGELCDEIAFHLDASARDHRETGLSPEKSEAAALQRFGDVTVVVHDVCDASIAGHVFWHRVHQAMTVALVVAVGWLAWTMRPSSQTSDDIVHPATGYSLAESRGVISGTVVDDQGRPVETAHVLAVVKTWPPNGYRQQSHMVTTRPDGSFVLEDVYPPGHMYEVQIAAVADGRLLESKYISMSKGKLEPVHFQLQKSTELAIRFESGNGEPISGVDVFPFQRVDPNGDRHFVYVCSADPIVRASNQSGSVPMPHFRPGDQATVLVRFPESDDWQSHELVVREGQSEVVLTPTEFAKDDTGA